MANIRDVAQRAGVSITTVSRVLNHDPSYKAKEETRKKVWQAATELSYVLPDRSPQVRVAQARQSSQRIGCILNANMEKFVDPYYQDVLDGVQKTLALHDLALSTLYDGRTLTEPDMQAQFLTEPLDALLLISYDLVEGSFYQRLVNEFENVVCVTDSRMWGNHDLVTYDHHEAVSLALSHLREQGHTRIAYIGGAGAYMQGDIRQEPRCRAFLDQMRLHGLSVPTPWVCNCHWSRSACRQHVISLLSAEERPTAILAGSDNMAAVVLNTLYEMRLRVPDDMAVMGICDLIFALYTTPPLTTVRVPTQAIGSCAAELLLSRLQGDISHKKHILFPVSLVRRGSV